MLAKTNAVHEAWAAAERTLDFKVTVNGTTYTATDITELDFDAGAMNGDALTLGSTYANTVKIVFSHLVEGLALTNEITPEIGIQLPDGTWDYTALGVFVIDSQVEQDRNNNTTTVSATDRFVMMGGTYTSKLDYPADVLDVATEIADQAGVQINATDLGQLPAAQVPSAIAGATLREAIGFVAQFCAGFATFDRDGQLSIRTLNDPEFTVTTNQYQSKGLTKNEVMYQVNGLTCEVEASDDDGTSDTVTLQSGNTTGNQIVLTNPVMTQTALDGLYTQLQDTNFYPFSLDWFGDPSLEVGDWIEIVDAAGNKFKTPNLLFTLTFNGSLTATSKADTNVTANSNFSYVNTNNKRIIRDLRARIDAAGHKITDGTEPPENPKLGDIWFAKDGPDTIIRIWTLNPDTGEAYWKDEVSTKTTSDIAAQIDEIMKQLKADEDALAEKLASNDAAQTVLNNKLDDNAAAINKVKQDTDSAVADVTAKVKQAADDTAKAVSQAGDAAATAANALTVAQAADSTSTDAKQSAAEAIDTANQAQADAKAAQDGAAGAITDAKSALDSAGTALTQAEDALKTGQDAQAQAAQVQTNLDTKSGEFSASISKVQTSIDGHTARNLIISKDIKTYNGTTITGDTRSLLIDMSGKLDDYPGIFYTGSNLKPSTAYVMSFDAEYIPIEGQTQNSAQMGGHTAPFTAVTATYNGQKINYWGDGGPVAAPGNSGHYVVTVTTTSTFSSDGADAFFIQPTRGGGSGWNVRITNWMLAEVAGPYSRAPEDLDAVTDGLQKQVTTNSTSIKTNADAIALKADQSVLNETNKTVQENSAALKVTAKQVDLTAAQQEIDTVSGKVDKANAQLVVQAGKIEAKAEQSSVDTLNGNVQKNTADILLNANALKAKLESSDLSAALSPYATQSWSQQQLTATSESWNQQLTTVQNQVNTMNVGSRNYLLGSNVSNVWEHTTTGKEMHYHSFSLSPDATKDLSGKSVYVSWQVDAEGVIADPNSRSGVELAGTDSTGKAIYVGGWKWFTKDVPDGKVSTRYVMQAQFADMDLTGLKFGLYDEMAASKVTLSKPMVSLARSEYSEAPEDLKSTVTDVQTKTNTLQKTSDETVAKLSDVSSKLDNTVTLTNEVKQTADGTVQTIAQVKTDLAGLDTVNLLLNSDVYSGANDQYQMGQYPMTERMVYGQTYTIVISGKMNSGGWWEAYLNGDMKDLGGSTKTTENTTGIFEFTFQGATYGNTDSDFIRIYSVPNPKNSPRWSQINWITMVKGSVGLKTYSPPPSEVATVESVHTVETTLTKSLDQLTNAQGQTASDLLTATNKLTTVEDTANKAKSQSSQNASDLLLRVEKADLLSEINLQAGSTLIKTGKLYLDAATVTFSGAAIIPSAAIMSLDATKITTGTLDASKATIINLNADSIVSGSIDTEKVTLKNLSASTIVSGELDASKVTVSNLSASNIIGGTLDANLVTVKDLSASSITSGTLNAGLLNVINLNADSITTGTLSGANLSMNLNTGEVLFTSGAITGTGMNMNLDSGVIDFTQGRFHDDAGTIDLNVDDGYIATSSGDSQMVLSKGKLLLTQKNIFDPYSATPYLEIANNVTGDSLASASIIGRDSVTVCNSANTGSIISMGVETLAGLFAGKATDGWKMTKVGGADRGVIISGGKMSGGALGDYSPSIVVGCNSSGGGKGSNRISIDASYVHIPSTYSRTISGSANVHVEPDGALVRSTSAAKYKTDILRTTSSAIGHKLLGIQTATWIDKADQARYASDPNHYERPARNFGMIADDLDAAGIPELVTYVDGEIEGINYDRIGPALVPVIRELNDKVNQLEALYNAIKNDKLTA